MEEEKKEHIEHKHEEHKETPKEHIQAAPHSDKKKVSINLDSAVIGLGIFLCILLLISVVLTASINSTLRKNIDEAKEKAKPAKIELKVITEQKCIDCFDINPILNIIKGANTEIIKQEYVDLSQADSLLQKYSIKKIPTVIISGEANKLNLEGFEKSGEDLVLTAIEPPYVSAETKKILGRVTAYKIVDPSCTKCFDIDTFTAQLKAARVKITEEKILGSDSEEAKAMLSKYKIDSVPALVLSEEASAYDVISQLWSQIGTKEEDGNYVLRAITPPFVNLTENRISGLIDVIYLTDKGCERCYNATDHRQILANPRGLNLAMDKERMVDVGEEEGKALIEKYNIALVPTIILSKDIAVYPSSQSIREFFSVQNDGSFVFVKLDVMGVHKNIKTGEIIEPKQEGQG